MHAARKQCQGGPWLSDYGTLLSARALQAMVPILQLTLPAFAYIGSILRRSALQLEIQEMTIALVRS